MYFAIILIFVFVLALCFLRMNKLGDERQKAVEAGVSEKKDELSKLPLVGEYLKKIEIPGYFYQVKYNGRLLFDIYNGELNTYHSYDESGTALVYTMEEQIFISSILVEIPEWTKQIKRVGPVGYSPDEKTSKNYKMFQAQLEDMLDIKGTPKNSE